MSEPAWRCVLFDLDGTLADTVELILRCYRHTMTVHLGEPPPDAEWLATIGTPLRDQLRRFARDEDEAGAMLETYTSFQGTVHDEMVAPYEGARETLERVASEGTRIGVVTSKRSGMARRTLDHCGLSRWVEVLVGADDVKRGKPDPEPVRLALFRLGVEAGPDVLFVGDSPWDVRAGRAAGVRTAAALWGPYGREALEDAEPDFWLEAVREVYGVRPV